MQVGLRTAAWSGDREEQVDWLHYFIMAFSKTVGERRYPEGVTFIPANMFYSNGGGPVTNVIFPSTLESIGNEAFRYNSMKGREIVIPRRCSSIGIRAFYAQNCTFVMEGRTMDETRAMSNWPWAAAGNVHEKYVCTDGEIVWQNGAWTNIPY